MYFFAESNVLGEIYKCILEWMIKCDNDFKVLFFIALKWNAESSKCSVECQWNM